MTFTEVKTVLEDLGYDVQIQPSIGNVQTHDLILVSADGQRAIFVAEELIAFVKSQMIDA